MKFPQNQALTSHFETFRSIVLSASRFLEVYFIVSLQLSMYYYFVYFATFIGLPKWVDSMHFLKWSVSVSFHSLYQENCVKMEIDLLMQTE